MTNAAPRLLLVDDNPANLRVLFEALQGAGYKISLAHNGEMALDVARRVVPDLMLLDITMPGIDGFEVCRRLRATPETREAAVIFLTASTDPQAKVAGLDLGAVDYITKPINVDEVLARIRVHLTVQRLNRQLASANRDLEQRVAERTAQLLHADRLATLGALTAGLLHEVRNPLVTLSGYHRLIRRSLDEMQQADSGNAALAQICERFTTAQQSAERVVEILENMLSFARKESRRGPVNLAEAIAEAAQMMAGLKADAAVHLDGPAAPVTVHASKAELLQVLMNLLQNSGDALQGRESPAIRVQWRIEGAQAVLQLSDNGPGVPEELRANLFRPFFTTKDRKGTGLGLMISRQIVESMAGSMSYQPGESGGAAFHIRLPLSSDAGSGGAR